MSGPSVRVKATKKAHEAAENPGALPGTPAGSNQLTLSAFNDGMAQMKTDICGKMDSVVDSLRAEIALVREGAQESLNNLQATSTAHEARLVEVEKCAAFCDNTATELLTKFDKLKCEVTDLQNKCDDLEGQQRRNNIRVLGVPEGVEGPHPTEYMADLLGDLLQLVDKPVLDRAHRSSRAKPRAGEPPRPFVIRVHHFQTKELILRKSRAAGDSLKFPGGNRISFFPDLAAAVAKKRAEFWKAKQMLRSVRGVKFGLLFPARLRVTLPDGKEHYFENPTEATVFAKRLAPGPGSV
ncbi:hypothetical protein NHX12_003775 [Muraenolepis orangiensis]|uniref:Uncharacterized protein n=1 Tax=Muraenolepis orangiensis TaxID=630683 RepID=A0A9Q0DVU3_9TELE|nr:hypothetical protein NHX12_003775 [Muraenolepis orangiensis]